MSSKFIYVQFTRYKYRHTVQRLRRECKTSRVKKHHKIKICEQQVKKIPFRNLSSILLFFLARFHGKYLAMFHTVCFYSHSLMLSSFICLLVVFISLYLRSIALFFLADFSLPHIQTREHIHTDLIFI